MKKYEFTGEVKAVFGRILHQIRATVTFGDVNAGDIGGWIEKEDNLSHDDEAWVYGEAQVYDKAWVCGEARVYGEAQVYGEARVYGEAWVCDKARVYGEAWVCDKAQVYDKDHYLVVGPIGSRRDFTTFFRTRSLKIFVRCGCFRGNIEAFVEKAKQTHGDNEHAERYLAAAELAKACIDLTPEE